MNHRTSDMPPAAKAFAWRHYAITTVAAASTYVSCASSLLFVDALLCAPHNCIGGGLAGSGDWTSLALWAAALFTVLAEEVIFRWFLLGLVLIRYCRVPPRLAVLLSAALFTIYHIPNYASVQISTLFAVMSIVSMAILGWCLGALYNANKALAWPLLAHFSWNAMAGLGYYAAYAWFAFSTDLSQPLRLGSYMCVAIVAAAVSVSFWRIVLAARVVGGD